VFSVFGASIHARGFEEGMITGAVDPAGRRCATSKRAVDPNNAVRSRLYCEALGKTGVLSGGHQGRRA